MYFILTINIVIVIVVIIIIITDDMMMFLTQTLYQLKTLEGRIHTQLSPYKYTLNMNSTMRQKKWKKEKGKRFHHLCYIHHLLNRGIIF